MRMVILSRAAGLYSTQRIYIAGIRRGHQMRVVDHLRCNMLIDQGMPRIFFDGTPLGALDAVIPRIGASVTFKGAALIRQFESMGIYSATPTDALVRARDKLLSLQLLAQARIQVPKTAFLNQLDDIPTVLQWLGGTPVVIKLLESTHGVGVILSESSKNAISVIETLSKTNERIIIQEFIQEARGGDIRAFVVGDEIVASMYRQAAEGEFRSNMHRGATAEPVTLTETEKVLVLKAAKVMGLSIAGVDFLRSNRGPLILEVNASPGLEGIEATSRVDIANLIIKHIERSVRAFKNEQS